MKQIYIHIGLHKTGSTYIQKVLAENRALLRSFDVDYPDLGAEFLFGHHNVAWSLIPNHALQNTEDFTLDQMLDYIDESTAKRFIISSEDFDFLQPDQVSKLKRLLFDYDVKIVMYVRNPMNALYSHWQESVKHGDVRPLRDYAEQLLANPQPLDYCRIADIWATVFGSQAMSFIIYENLAADNTDIALYLLREILAINIESRQINISQGKINPSSSIGIIEVIRQLNELKEEQGNPDKITTAFMAFLRHHPQGKALKQHLQDDYGDSYDFVDLTPLEKTFSSVSEEFFKTYKDQIRNIHSSKTLFDNPTGHNRSVVQLVNADILAKKIDIKKLYSLINLPSGTTR